ncbi:MAG: LPS export ABC transporter ATP-binding protein [Halanaerobiaceae bacterium]|nr:LPS export ABC transporter ATP-binding protein [Halanaerobiaceae bacterium]
MSIVATGLVKEYNKQRVVNEVDLTVERGEVVGLLGPNGAGKTTTFYMVVGIVKPNNGRIFLDGKEITNLPVFQRARRGIGYLSQEPSVFRKMTVQNNILAILQARKLSREEIRQKLEELLEEFDIAHLRNRMGYQLSGGERRRVEIARSLATDPSFILLDEPFAGVDPIAVSDIQNIITYLKERGLGVLITDHSVRETLSITDKAYIMHEGKILLSGSSDEVANNELARKFYLGERFSM